MNLLISAGSRKRACRGRAARPAAAEAVRGCSRCRPLTCGPNCFWGRDGRCVAEAPAAAVVPLRAPPGSCVLVSDLPANEK